LISILLFTVTHLSLGIAWVPVLDPGDIQILSLGAIWGFGKGIGHS